MTQIFERTVRTRKRVEFVNIDAELHRCIAESGVKDGICIVFVPHTTAAVTINENADPDVQRDIISELDNVLSCRKLLDDIINGVATLNSIKSHSF